MRLLAVFLIATAGLILRLDAAWHGTERNLPDSAAYERIARGLHEDQTFTQKGPGTPIHPQPASNYSPGLPLAVAGVFDLAGHDDVRLARILLALVSSLSIPMAWLLARRLSPGGEAGVAGIAAAAVVAFYPCLIADAGMLLTESLAGTLIIGALLAIVRARDRARADSPRSLMSGALDWALPGLLLGLAAMVRPEYLGISILLAGALVLINRRHGLRPALLGSAAMLAALFLVIAPWTIRNLDQTGRFVPLSTGGGQTLFTGSYLDSGGDPLEVMPAVLRRNPDVAREIEAQNRLSGEGVDSITPERVLALLAADRMPGIETDVALADMGRQNYLRALQEDPAGLAGFLTGKAARIWWRGRTDLTGTAIGRAVHMTLIAAALAGLVLLGLRRRPEFWLIATLAVGATVIGVLLVASPRRTLTLWPVIACLSGIGLAGAARLARDAVTGRLRPVRIA
ncbi:MAG: hypothetical protein J0H98_07690 [Solirubrobacterales bacterium]|nr:hypothetical protein [Solirubrobacterales bacterium]